MVSSSGGGGGGGASTQSILAETVLTIIISVLIQARGVFSAIDFKNEHGPKYSSVVVLFLRYVHIEVGE